MDLLDRKVSIDGGSWSSPRDSSSSSRCSCGGRASSSRASSCSSRCGVPFDPGTNVVDVYVGYLRKKIGPERIETVRNRGYRSGGDGRIRTSEGGYP